MVCVVLLDAKVSLVSSSNHGTIASWILFPRGLASLLPSALFFVLLGGGGLRTGSFGNVSGFRFEILTARYAESAASRSLGADLHNSQSNEAVFASQP